MVWTHEESLAMDKALMRINELMWGSWMISQPVPCKKIMGALETWAEKTDGTDPIDQEHEREVREEKTMETKAVLAEIQARIDQFDEIAGWTSSQSTMRYVLSVAKAKIEEQAAELEALKGEPEPHKFEPGDPDQDPIMLSVRQTLTAHAGRIMDLAGRMTEVESRTHDLIVAFFGKQDE